MEHNEGMALIRPEMIQLSENGQIEGIVHDRIYHGNSMRYNVKVGNTLLLVDDYNVFDKTPYIEGQTIHLDIPKKVHLIPVKDKAIT